MARPARVEAVRDPAGFVAGRPKAGGWVEEAARVRERGARAPAGARVGAVAPGEAAAPVRRCFAGGREPEFRVASLVPCSQNTWRGRYPGVDHGTEVRPGRDKLSVAHGSSKGSEGFAPANIAREEGKTGFVISTYGDAPIDAARSAGLRYVTDTGPGISRRQRGRGFSYTDPERKRLVDTETIARIKALAIPPAWTDVWICPHPLGHIQATGRDARGRKQYRYHPQWRAIRDETKYGGIVSFGEALPRVRRRTGRHLAMLGLPREKVLAAVVRILDTSLVRVGNPEYTRMNDSFGLTTLRDEHARIEGSVLRFRFRGKGGKQHTVHIQDARLARIVKRCQDIPGEELFQYIDDDGDSRPITSGDVNEYLRDISGEGLTSKDFRTWGGTVLAAEALLRQGRFASETEARSNVVEAIKEVAAQLNNTPAVCRKAYVHPEVIQAYMDGDLVPAWRRAERSLTEWPKGLRREEAILLSVLRNRSAAARETQVPA
jgi:DNA topoisomerase I